MKYIEYKERREQGTFNFPIALHHLTRYHPRYHMQLHWHTQYELIRIVSGTFYLMLDQDAYTAYAGDVFFVRDGMLHGGMPSEGCIYDCIVFDLEILMKNNHICSRTIQEIKEHKIVFSSFISQKSEAVSVLTGQLCDVLAERKEGYEFMTQGYLYQLIGTMIQEKLYEEAEKKEETGRLDAVKAVLDYISEHYSDSISLESLSRIAGMNPRYFCRYFRNMTERTPIDYLNYYRIECACEMLLTRQISIKEAAISCGFNDESYFIKTFHKYKGITPGRYMDRKMD